MAKAKYISENEKQVIKIAYEAGFKAPSIARYLGRGKLAIYNHIEAMQKADMMATDAMDFLKDQICEGIKANEAKNGKG